MDQKEYFAARESTELASHLEERRGDYISAIQSNGLQKKWKRSFELYYGKHFRKAGWGDGEIMQMGEKGELAAFAINHYRNLIKNALVLTTNQKPSFSTSAINSDPASLEDTKLGNAILEYYMNEHRIGAYFKRASEHAQVIAKGFVCILWDPGAGRPFSKKTVTDPETGDPKLDPETGEPEEQVVHEGDLDIFNPIATDVLVDPRADDWRHLNWVDVRRQKNKYDLAAQYPAFREQILALSSEDLLDPLGQTMRDGVSDSDNVSLYYFIHKKTRALPNGRLQIRVGSDCVLYDGPTPYEHWLPVFRIVPGEVFGTTEGYTDAFDLMGMQEALDILVSIAFTNQQANGVQKVWQPTGGETTISQVSKGLTMMRSPAGTKPEPLQLTATAAEIFNMLPLLQKGMESVYGINAASRGDPDSQLKSGVAIQYVQSMSAVYTSAFQQSWAELLEDGGTFILWLLKHFGNAPRMIAITGKRKRAFIANFTKDDLQNVDRVKVNVGNPMTNTVASRLEVADNLLEKGLITTPQEYFTVKETGALEPLYEDSDSQLSLVHMENDDLRDGKPCQALVMDSHLLHMKEHRTLFSDPEIRRSPAKLAEATKHYQDHVNLYMTQNPLFAMIAGEPPAPQPMMPPPPGPGQDPGAPPPPPAGPGAPPMPPGPANMGPPPQAPQMMPPPNPNEAPPPGA